MFSKNINFVLANKPLLSDIHFVPTCKGTVMEVQTSGCNRLCYGTLEVMEAQEQNFQKKKEGNEVEVNVKGKQNMPPQNIPLCHKDYFEKLQTQEKL